VYESVSLKSNDDISSVAKAALSMALEYAHYGAAGDRITYGNPSGLELLEDKHDLKERVKRLEDKQAKSEREIANHKTHKTQISYLQDRVKALSQAFEGYRKFRHRFIDVYRRDVLDVLDDLDRQGCKKIGEGNQVTHEGDVVTDAGLYTFGGRFDEDVLVDLYGLSASQISQLCKCRTSLSLCSRKLMLYSPGR